MSTQIETLKFLTSIFTIGTTRVVAESNPIKDGDFEWSLQFVSVVNDVQLTLYIRKAGLNYIVKFNVGKEEYNTSGCCPKETIRDCIYKSFKYTESFFNTHNQLRSNTDLYLSPKENS